MPTLISFFITFFLLLIFDVTWIYSTYAPLYTHGIGHLLSESFGSSLQIMSALGFYISYAFGVTHFVIAPFLDQKAPYKELGMKAFKKGQLFGFVAYGTYAFTNQAVMRDWPLDLTLYDLVWGTYMTGTLSAVSYLLFRRLNEWKKH